MKKSIIILFSLFYLMIASGLTLSLHYCGGKLKAISLFSSNEEGCCGNKKKSKGCCQNKIAFIKIKDSHNSSDSINLTYNYFKILDVALPTQIFEIPNESISYSTLNYHAPPVIYDNPLYLKHRVLLI